MLLALVLLLAVTILLLFELVWMKRLHRAAHAEHLRAESALQESDTRNRAILNALPDLMFVLGRNGTYVDYYAGSASELYVTPDQVRGKRLQDVLPSDAVAAIEPAIKKVAASGEPAAAEYKLLMPGGTRFYEARMVPLAPDQVLGTVRQLTRTRRAEPEQELQGLSMRLNIQDDERGRIARELRDGTAQVLFGISATVASLRQQSGLPGEAAHALAECQRLCDEGLSQVHLLSYLLHPPRLDEGNLTAALSWFTEGFSTRSGIDVQLDAPETLERLPLALERSLFRIVQEALGNVARHSGSHQAVVRLRRSAGQIVLQIQDFGCGMPSVPGDEGGGHLVGLGILGIREQLGYLGGRLDIESTAEGTTVTATAPLHLEEA